MRKLLTAILLMTCFETKAELFSGYNHPANFNVILGTTLVTDMDQLPLSGKLNDSRLGWSESYWPSSKGGIAYRWNHPDPKPFQYNFFSLAELKRMNLQQLSQLSPAELYDISEGDYQYTLTRKVLGMFSPKDLWWEGICHGWAQAASNYPEPRAIVIKNKDGLKIPFGSSDVKALLAMHDAYNFKGGVSAFVGLRCKANGKVEGEGGPQDNFPLPPIDEEANSSECKDVNAGAFHLILTNMIGIHSKGFVADVDRFNDVWNQPVTSYTTKFLGEEATNSLDHEQGIFKKIKIQTRMTYGEELQFYTPEKAARGDKNFVSKKPVTETIHQEFRFKDYIYILELDNLGHIKGGEWISETRPDFLWIIGRHGRFQNSPIPLQGLNTIYRPLKR